MFINYLENCSHPSKVVTAAANMNLKHKFPCLYMPVFCHIDIVKGKINSLNNFWGKKLKSELFAM